MDILMIAISVYHYDLRTKMGVADAISRAFREDKDGRDVPGWL